MKKILFTLIIIVNVAFTSCNSSKELTSFEHVKNGKELEKATQISLNDFFQKWIRNKSDSKLDQNLYELFKDENFTYFGANELKSLNSKRKLYSVENNSLLQNFKNYKDVDGASIRQEFSNKMIPETDRNIYKNSNCSSSSSNPKYSCELKNNEIQIMLIWKFRCDGKVLIDKTYKGIFDLNIMKLAK